VPVPFLVHQAVVDGGLEDFPHAGKVQAAPFGDRRERLPRMIQQRPEHPEREAAARFLAPVDAVLPAGQQHPRPRPLEVPCDGLGRLTVEHGVGGLFPHLGPPHPAEAAVVTASLLSFACRFTRHDFPTLTNLRSWPPALLYLGLEPPHTKSWGLPAAALARQQSVSPPPEG
jgi:hypothetical protein